MCLLIAKPAGIELPDNLGEICAEAAEVNDDGFGFATIDQVYKSASIKPDEFAALLRSKISKTDPAIIHFRFSTSGFTSDDNCHPFVLNDGTVFAHNGNISYKFSPRNGISDTGVLAQSVKNGQELFERCVELAGPSNKFAMLSPANRELKIVGEEHGSWYKDGLWYSNDYWRSDCRKSYYGGYTFYRGGQAYKSAAESARSFSHLTSEDLYPGNSLEDKIEALVKKYGITRVYESLGVVCSWFQE